MRSLEKRLSREPCWASNRAESRAYLDWMRKELNRAAAKAERHRHPDQWSLPAAEVQLSQLRRSGVEFELPLTRREAHDLLEATREAPGATPVLATR